MATPQDARAARLSKLLHSYTQGSRAAKSAADGKLLLEAIAAQQDSVGCVERLVASKNAHAALQLALRFDLTPTFFNSTFKDFITVLRDPAVRQACGGHLCKQLLTVTLNPPTLWTALSAAHDSRQLTVEGEICFAWLLFELITWTDHPPIIADELAQDITKRKSFLAAEDHELRTLGYRIENVLQTKETGARQDAYAPGGRHDNDHSDFRKIAFFPTNDELLSKQMPFYLPANAIKQKSFSERPGSHLENQFRLLREDFLAELRDDIKASTGGDKRHRHPRTVLQGLALAGMYCGDRKFKTPFALTLSVQRGLEELTKRDESQRKAFVKNNPKYLKHQSFGCVLDRQQIVTFATLIRAEDKLLEEVPLVTLRVPDRKSLENLLLTLKTSETAKFVLVDTPVFAYEPVLRCLQSTVELPLSQELFAVSAEEIEASVRESKVSPLDLLDDIKMGASGDLQKALSLPKSVTLDNSQLESLMAGLYQSVSLIQGPPGYTGISPDDIVRLGAKSTPRTESLQLFKPSFKGQRPWNVINAKKDEADEHESKLRGLLSALKSFKVSDQSLMEYLEFEEDDSDFYKAFQLPEHDAEEQIIGEGGKKVTKFYLLQRWARGQDAGIFSAIISDDFLHIWTMGRDSRAKKLDSWREQLVKESIGGIGSIVDAYNKSEHIIREAFDQKNAEIIQTKRIIACTTTAAAKYTKQLRSASPGIVVVEEAGEILESHILTALTPETKQLILIGDHQQLRPKINNYALTVENHSGYDLNRSMFERLILGGFPHTTLLQQHRMCPEISSLVRHLTYPDLEDAPSTRDRDPLRGLSSRVVFIDHRNLELAASAVADRRDAGSTVSKQNQWEASMILKVVRYMAQQGYGTANQAVLTPYLGQLSLLRQELSKEHDPVLSDLDSFELVKAGLLSPANAAQQKRPLRMSTIDNFQGEESDIVIVSLTRSNDHGDIGFMASPERLNVLLSRARECLVLIGNFDTFLASRKGEAVWKPFLKMLADRDEIYHGLPARCQSHPDRQVELKQPEDFVELCPDGGCLAPCEVKLSCGLHNCPQKCHSLADHSKMPCQEPENGQCPKGHKVKWTCSQPLEVCPKCDAEAKAEAKRQSRDKQLDQARQQRQARYADQLAEIQDEIDHERRIMRESREDHDRESSLRQKWQDLENARKQRARMSKEKETSPPQIPGSFPLAPADQDINRPDSPSRSSQTGDPQDASNATTVSAARGDWEAQKTLFGADNKHLDELMDMIGLENVKEDFLDLKAKVDLTVRQGVDLSKERFGVSLLGNPGVGKTTVARLYGKFLASVGALPGDEFCETTGAKLANQGIGGCEKILDGIKSNGGGTLFIDEAYQLTSGANSGGAAVLDFLLAEVENLTGKVVFILAGYNKNMESFFAHNPGLPSRFPRRIQFADYEDKELLDIFNYRLARKYGKRMQVEGGSKGLYARIVVRRLGRGRGKVGFGNARAVENALQKIASRQARRVGRERSKRKNPSDFLLTMEDLIGPEPEKVLKNNKAWEKMQSMVGLSSVKDSVHALFESIKYNYQRELEEKAIMDFSLNKVFLGSPGTGKTTIAKLYGQVLADLGLLSTNEVIIKTPADLVGSVIGASEANTKACLDAAMGKVLVIDEAYGLHSGTNPKDPYRIAIIDTIVSEVQNVPGDDRCVLLLGYKEQMENMMQTANPGLARRFPIASGFLFEDFTDGELAIIFDSKLNSQAFTVTEKAREVAFECLGRMRNRPNFGNAGEIDILLNDAKVRQQKRFARDRLPPTAEFEAEDFDPDYTRADNAGTNLHTLFEGVIGCEAIVSQVQDYQNIVANMRSIGMDPRPELPFTFLFRGPPGTGKTTTARKMGQVYYDMGFLATPEVIECSAKDLIGEYVGHTGPKAQKLIESALGRVLFVDEAYRLGDGQFAKEAVDELVDCITKTKFLNKVVIILAGYVHELNRLMDVNPGLSSRFSESIDFQPLKPRDCLKLLQSSLDKRKQIDTSVLSPPAADFEQQALERFQELSSLANFANGRDVLTIAKAITARIMKGKMPTRTSLAVSKGLVIDEINVLISERKARTHSASSLAPPILDSRPLPTRAPTKEPSSTPQATSGAPAQATDPDTGVLPDEDPSPASSDDDEGPEDGSRPSRTAKRDAGVSDETWEQLQKDTLLAEEKGREGENLAQAEEELRRFLKASGDAKEKRESEEAERKKRELEDIERKRREVEEQLRQEAEAKEKLKRMGRCPVGYEWIRQSGGYRCAGGSHWVSDGQMVKMMGG
ncbi:hypothetical protein MBLNU230_g3676t1 [Neophaeotheca triangularis]